MVFEGTQHNLRARDANGLVKKPTPRSEADKVGKSKHKGSRKPKPDSSSSSSPSDSSNSTSDSSPSESSSDSETDSDTSSSSSSSDESSSSSSSSSTDSSSRKTSKKRSKRTKKSKKSKKDKSSSSYKPAFKPVIYSGQANLSDYHRFVREATSYVDMAKIPKKHQIVTISHFLKDTAYDFYSHKVASKQKDWKLGRFLKEMFNHCFPVDYTAQMRMKLNRIRQGDMTVDAFVFELEQLFGMFGDLSKRQKALYLWYGLRREIQERMWIEKLNPDISSWKEILDMAVVIEISLGVGNKGDRKGKTVSLSAKDTPRKNTGGENSNQGNPRRDQGPSNRQTYNNPSARTDTARQPNGRHRPPRSRNNSHRGNSQFRRPQNGRYENNNARSDTRRPPRVSDKEREERRSKGLCYKCGGDGHFGRNCPHGDTIHSSGSKPPGLSTHNVEFVDDNNYENVEVLDSLPLGAISFDELDSRSDTVSEHAWVSGVATHQTWQHPAYFIPRRSMGDCYLMVATELLESQSKFTGDEPVHTDVTNRRFELTRQNTDKQGVFYFIEDKLAGTFTKVWLSDLKNPHFDLVNWYNKQLCIHRGIDVERLYGIPIGDAPARVAERLLQDGINSHYPTLQEDLDPEGRFYVHPATHGSSLYIIEDADLEIQVEVPLDHLECPAFNLVDWYNAEIYHVYQETCSVQVNSWKEAYELRASEPSEECGQCVDHYEPSLCEPEYSDLPELQSVSNSDCGSDSVTNEPPPLEPVTPSTSEYSASEGTSDSSDISELTPDDSASMSGDSPLLASMKNPTRQMGEVYAEQIARVLTRCQPYPADETHAIQPWTENCRQRFTVERGRMGTQLYVIYDRVRGLEAYIHEDRIRHADFPVAWWYAHHMARLADDEAPELEALTWLGTRHYELALMGDALEVAAALRLLEGAPYSQDRHIGVVSPSQRFCVTPFRNSETELLVEDRWYTLDG
ncbi:hypothetical protein CVT26_012894, partial [Gymnopilus dilepis]